MTGARKDVAGGTELRSEEDRLWTELNDLVRSMPTDQVDTPGYFEEGWSAKDLVAHLGSWLAEAGVVLERIRAGTYREDEIDIDALNVVFFDAMHDVAFADVRSQAVAARHRMLSAWGTLGSPSSDADWWIAKAGPTHYEEHLPRLRDWVAQVAAG